MPPTQNGSWLVTVGFFGTATPASIPTTAFWSAVPSVPGVIPVPAPRIVYAVLTSLTQSIAIFAARVGMGINDASYLGGIGTSIVSGVWEVAGIDGVDKSAGLSDQIGGSVELGAPVTTTRQGDFVVSVDDPFTNVTGIHSGNNFTDDSLLGGTGWAHLNDKNTPPGTYQAQWDTTDTSSDTYATVTLALTVIPTGSGALEVSNDFSMQVRLR